MYAVEQAASQMPLWLQLPWGTFAMIAFAAGVGTLYADIINKDSRIRAWWRDVRSFGDFGSVKYSKVFYAPGEDSGPKQAYIDIAVSFKFRGSTNLQNVRISAVIRRLAGVGINPEFAEHQWRAFEQGSFLENESIEIRLARLAIDPAHNGFYGDLTKPYVGMYTEHHFRVEIFAGGRKQAKRFYLRVPHNRSDLAIDPDQYLGNRFVFLAEDDDVFSEEDFPALGRITRW